MFTARYALSPYITQIQFVFKGLILNYCNKKKRTSINNCKFFEFLIYVSGCHCDYPTGRHFRVNIHIYRPPVCLNQSHMRTRLHRTCGLHLFTVWQDQWKKKALHYLSGFLTHAKGQVTLVTNQQMASYCQSLITLVRPALWLWVTQSDVSTVWVQGRRHQQFVIGSNSCSKSDPLINVKRLLPFTSHICILCTQSTVVICTVILRKQTAITSLNRLVSAMKTVFSVRYEVNL